MHEALVQGAFDALRYLAASNFQQFSIFNARWASRLAIQAGQAAIQVLLGLTANGLALKHLFDLVDTATGAIKFIAQKLIGRASGVAKTTVYAGSQDFICALSAVSG